MAKFVVAESGQTPFGTRSVMRTSAACRYSPVCSRSVYVATSPAANVPGLTDFCIDRSSAVTVTSSCAVTVGLPPPATGPV